MLFEEFNPAEGKRLEILNEKGECNEKLKPDMDDNSIKRLYELMVFIRIADEKALNLQRTGRMGTYAPIQGQEACQVGSAVLFRKGDWVFPAFRELAAMFICGIPLKDIYLYWMGHETSSSTSTGINVFPVSIAVGTHLPHAVGAALAEKLRKTRAVAVCYFGDGATSVGDFHEAMNFAGVTNAPVIFFCQNNQFAISVRREQQTAAKTIAQKAFAYGFPGIQVDGNDIFAVHAATKEAIMKARSGQGPSLIEAYTYRLSLHTTADDPTRYRTQDEVNKWKLKDPIKRLQLYLAKNKLWSSSYEEKLRKKIERDVDAAAKESESVPAHSEEDIFKYMYKEMTPRLKAQLSYLREVSK